MSPPMPRTYQDPWWTLADLVRAKGERTVSVVLPALNEEDTVAGVIESVRPMVGSLVDEIVVVDSGSTDRTAEKAEAAGARVVERCDVLPGLEPVPGKGEVLWRALAATSGDIVVYLDADLVEPDPFFVPGLIGPLLLENGVHLVKGFYRRPLRTDGQQSHSGGGRVTELLARPILHALRPALSGVVQPLGGEYAATRELLTSVPFAAGYGVDIGLLLDAEERYGLSAIAQVNLGVRIHRNRPLHELGVMARQLLGTVLDRCGVDAGDGAAFAQFVQLDEEWVAECTEVHIDDRPPMREVLARRGSA